MRLSKEVVELESQETRMNFDEHYRQVMENDPAFASVLDTFQDMMAEKCKNYYGTIAVTNHAGEESQFISVANATEVLNKAALSIYYLMGVQAEIDETERECGYESENENS